MQILFDCGCFSQGFRWSDDVIEDGKRSLAKCQAYHAYIHHFCIEEAWKHVSVLCTSIRVIISQLLASNDAPESQTTEALKGHRVVWKIEICYLIRMTYEWKPMSSGWHNSIVVTHPDEIPISAKSSGWHTVYDMSSGWHTAVSKSHPDEIRPGANSSGWLRVQMMLCHPDEIGEYRKSSGWHTTMPISHPDVIPPIVKSSGWDTANS